MSVIAGKACVGAACLVEPTTHFPFSSSGLAFGVGLRTGRLETEVGPPLELDVTELVKIGELYVASISNSGSDCFVIVDDAAVDIGW